MTLWIGLTGGIGSGKSSVAQMFAELGVPIIDADAISRSLTAENGEALPAIRQLFGDEVFDNEGRLNRTALREEVFRRPQSKKTTGKPASSINLKQNPTAETKTCFLCLRHCRCPAFN